jgi:Proline dehydrogenase
LHACRSTLEDPPELAAQAVAAYHEVLATIAQERLPANISVKPTQMGLKIAEELALNNLREVVEDAARRGIFVRMDMEDATTTDATLRIYRALRQQHSNLGVVLQARLRRTLEDARVLGAEGTNVRLCKGIYLEPRSIAYEEPEIVRWAFVHALEALFAGKGYVAIATHDEWLVEQSLALAGYRARIRNHGHSCFLCEIVIRSQFHTTYEPEA